MCIRDRDIVSGCDDGHVHVVNFPPDMAGVPTMKVRVWAALLRGQRIPPVELTAFSRNCLTHVVYETKRAGPKTLFWLGSDIYIHREP